jgi:GT2 family glycosyltransferase/glycosyltransferase involved in cell wall biosynthesis
MLRELLFDLHSRVRVVEDKARARVWQASEPLRKIETVSALLTWLANTTRRAKPGEAPLPRPRAFTLPDTAATLRKLRAQRLTLPTSDAPDVSIIIPVYNQLALTYACLEALAAHTQGPSYEVIVVDDCSRDETPEMLATVDGIRALRNREQLGFVGACNAGAAQARGAFLVFLNNDTEVQPGWLRELRETFTRQPRAGLVGAKLIYPDGRLQEAGGIVWQGGAAWNVGKLGDAHDPRWSYARQVDYCSGACIMIARALFESLGGFDMAFAPAYFEDVDLAFRVRRAGHEVWYQPLAEVMHVEGASNGTSVASGLKRYQVVNAEKFAARWSQAIAGHRSYGVAPDLEQDRGRRGRVLIVDAFTPRPDRDAGSLRMFNLTQILLQLGFKVTLVPADLAFDGEYTRELQRRGVEVLHHPFVSVLARYLRRHADSYDLIILSRAVVAGRFMEITRKAARRAKIIFDTVDLHHLREMREAELKNDAALMRKAEQRRADELRYMTLADCTLVVSAYEAELLAKTAPGIRVRIVSLIHDVHGLTAPFAERDGIMFLGGYRHPPNVDAATWLVTEILPRLHARVPGVTLHLIGPDAPESIRALGGEHVVVAGFVPDIEPYFRRCRLSVAPLRFGAGVKGKINSSLSHGVPVVATSLAIEGMHLVAGKEALVADDADGFAAAVAQLYSDEQLWQTLSRAGIDLTERHFSFAAARTAVIALLAELLPAVHVIENTQ